MSAEADGSDAGAAKSAPDPAPAVTGLGRGISTHLRAYLSSEFDRVLAGPGAAGGLGGGLAGRDSPLNPLTTPPLGAASRASTPEAFSDGPAPPRHREYLRVEELVKVKPPQDMPVRFSHVAILHAMDTNKDGRFSLEELCNFVGVCIEVRKHCRPHEFETLLQGRCVTQLLKAARKASGVIATVDWIMRMLADSYPVVKAGPGEVECIPIDAVFVIYRVLCSGSLSALDFTPSQLLDLLHLAAEEQGLLDLDDGELDDLVPVVVMRSFLSHFLRSMVETLQPVGVSARAGGGVSAAAAAKTDESLEERKV